MFHYFNSITNVHGDALSGFFVKAVDTTTGLTATLYADVSLTPIISTSGLADAALVDDDGNVNFFVTSGTYHLDIYAPNATTLIKRVSDIPMYEYSPIATSKIGYATGAGGTVTQLTSKSTAVTLDKLSGQITTHNASLAANTVVGFTLNNSMIAASDLVIVQLQIVVGNLHGIGDYSVRAGQISNGSVGIAIQNTTTGALAESLILNFAIIKGATA